MKIHIKLSIILIFVQLSALESAANRLEQQVFTYISSKNWPEAEKCAKKSANNSLLKIVLSQKFLDTKYNRNNFPEISKFLQNNPYWPQSEQIGAVAEGYIKPDLDRKNVYDYYQKSSPKTANGYKYYAIAALKFCQDRSKLASIVREGWIYGNFTTKEKRHYYKDFAKYIREEDHIKRIDELLWQHDVMEAKNSLHWVSRHYRESFKAQISAILKEENTDKLFSQIPQQYYTNGLLFHYLQYKKQEDPSKAVLILFTKAGSNPTHVHDWWRLRAYYAREYIRQKDFDSAYRLVSNHFNKDAADLSDAEFMAGWLSLRFLNKPNSALKHFTRFRQVVTTPMSISRGDYWLARTYDQKGEKELAKKFYISAASYGYTFYGQLAGIELNQSKLALPNYKVSTALPKRFSNPELIKATKLIAEYGDINLAQLYAKTAIKQAKNKNEILFISSLIKTASKTHHTVELSRTATQKHVFIKNQAFPTPYKKAHFATERSLGYAIMRHESSFNQYAIDEENNGDGFGLMQLTKDTAHTVAKSIGVKCDIPKLTKDPIYNIKLGTSHLKSLFTELDGSYVLTIASYNAGTHRAYKWIELYGDPRKMKNIKDIVDWIELVPFYTTRNYIQRVLENLSVYKALLHKNNNLSLEQHLRPAKHTKST